MNQNLHRLKTYRTSCNTQITRILSGRSNAYLVSGGKKNLLVDTGKTSSGNRLINRLEALLPPGKGLDFLVLTHTHFDHCQNVTLLQEHYGGCSGDNGFRIIMHEREKDCAIKGFTPLPGGTNWLTKEIVKIGNHLNKKRFSYKPFIPDILTGHETDLADSGCSVRLLETPGHSTGSLSLIIDDEIAIVGDTLFGIYPNSVFPPFAEDVAEMIKSWQRLLETGASLFLPGHGREIGRGLLEREVERYKVKNKKSY